MVYSTKARYLLLLISLFLQACVAQESASTKTADNQADAEQWKDLKIASEIEIPSVSEPVLTLPVFCGPDGRTFVRMASPPAVADLVSISSDGKNVVRYSSASLNDVNKPREGAFFVTDSDVYILATGFTPEGKTLELRLPDGQTTRQPASKPRSFIARFKKDGTYAGSVPLDLIFTPLQIGVFPGGSFLVAGVVEKTTEPRVALVNPDGQFLRFVEIKGDIHLHSAPDISAADSASQGQGGSESNDDPAGLPLVGKTFSEGLSMAVHFSMIIADGRDLALVRKNQKTPIFVVSPGGEVRNLVAEIPDGYRLYDLKSARNKWIATYAHLVSNDEGLELQTVALDRNTGSVIERYTYPKFLGLGIACADDLGFSFLMRENNALKLVKLVPEDRSSSVKGPPHRGPDLR